VPRVQFIDRVAPRSETDWSHVHVSCMRDVFVVPDIKPIPPTVYVRIWIIFWVARGFVGGGGDIDMANITTQRRIRR
jgi:hypothetical protein